MSSSSRETDSSICVGCGLCCDGTLNASTTVRTEDTDAVIAVGLEVVKEGDRSCFRQPCPHFSRGTCSVYAERPHVCRNYRCALLRAVEAGSITAPVAREKIATAKELRDAVRIAGPGVVTPPERAALMQRLKAQLADASGDDRQAVANALLDIAVFEHFLARWFLKTKDSATASSKKAEAET
jgi:Fe-S-cluster containining protein